MDADDWFQELFLLTVNIPDEAFSITACKYKAIDFIRKKFGRNNKVEFTGGDFIKDLAAHEPYPEKEDALTYAFIDDVILADHMLGTCIKNKVLFNKSYKETCDKNGWTENQIWYRLRKLREFMGSCENYGGALCQ